MVATRPIAAVSEVVRRMLFALLLFGIVATAVDLLLLAHHEDAWQWIPLLLDAIALPVLGWTAVRGTGAGVRALRAIMLAFVVAGLVGIFLHCRGNLEFQLEIDAAQGAWELFRKVMRAKAPPALAPGAMVQLGLLGLVSTYRHPALGRDGSSG